MELHCDAGAILEHLTPGQRLHLDALDLSFIRMISAKVPDKADVDALAESIVAFHDGLADVGSELRNGSDGSSPKMRT